MRLLLVMQKFELCILLHPSYLPPVLAYLSSLQPDIVVKPRMKRNLHNLVIIVCYILSVCVLIWAVDRRVIIIIFYECTLLSWEGHQEEITAVEVVCDSNCRGKFTSETLFYSSYLLDRYSNAMIFQTSILFSSYDSLDC